VEYFVIGPDGQEYGPAALDTLQQWVTEKRILPNTMLKSAASGLTVAASTVEQLFPKSGAPPVYQTPTDWSQPPTAGNPRPGVDTQQMSFDDGKRDVVRAIAYAAIALALFAFTRGGGLFIGAYGVFAAFRARSKGHRLSNVAIAISIVAFVLVGIGFYMRMNDVQTPGP